MPGPEMSANEAQPQDAAPPAPQDTGPPAPGDTAPPLSREGPLVLSDVYLLTAESQGNTAVPGLSVLLDESGMKVRKPDGTTGAYVAWTDVSGLVAERRMRTPAGHPGVVIEAVTSSRTHQFLVPSDNPEGLEYEIAQLANAVVAAGTSSRPSHKRRSLTLVRALVAVVVVAGIALAVLAATGTVKF